jgi:hypothetical protein
LEVVEQEDVQILQVLLQYFHQLHRQGVVRELMMEQVKQVDQEAEEALQLQEQEELEIVHQQVHLKEIQEDQDHLYIMVQVEVEQVLQDQILQDQVVEQVEQVQQI